MELRLPLPDLLGAAIWSLAAVSAVWLASGETGVADAPAQVIALEYRVASIDTGRLAEVLVSPGQRVLPGQLLARLDSSLLERELAVALAQWKQFDSETGASLAQIESDGYESERAFQADVDDAAAQLDSARAASSRGAAELQYLRQETARQRHLVREGLAKVDRVAELETRITALEAESALWPSRIDAMGFRLQAARARLDEWQARHRVSASAAASRKVRIQPLLERASGQLETVRAIRTRVANASLVAAAEADVVSILASPGDVVRAGEPFIILKSATLRQLVAYVSERDGGRLARGVRAILRPRTISRREFETTVARVANPVVQFPARFWVVPALAQWGREVFLEIPAGAPLDVGETFDVKFLTGGDR
jgi:multidrug resistance efflux pump